MDATNRAEAERLIAECGEQGFRERVAELTDRNLDKHPLKNVVALFDAHRRGKLLPAGTFERFIELWRDASPATADDTGFSDRDGNMITGQQWEEVETERRRLGATWTDSLTKTTS